MKILRCIYPNFNNGQELAYSCLASCETLGDHRLKVEAWFPGSKTAHKLHFVRNAYPRWAMPLLYRLPEPDHRLRRGVESAFLRALKPGDIAYIWPGVSLKTFQQIKDRGNIIVSQRTNCHRVLAKRLLDQEYARIGWNGSHGITEAALHLESEKMSLVDFVYAMNPFVSKSLEEANVPKEKILPTSSAWDPHRLKGKSRLREKEKVLTALFVGELSVRKGIHLLLESWKCSGVKGRLLLAGRVSREMEEKLAGLLAHQDVVKLGYQPDIGSAYRSADLFVCPSLEEGGPKVTYEAMGCGLPVLVSPMGAGPARDGVCGSVIDSHDIDGWAAAFRRFANDKELREKMGSAARVRAKEFTWQKVNAKRRESLLTAMGGLG